MSNLIQEQALKKTNPLNEEKSCLDTDTSPKDSEAMKATKKTRFERYLYILIKTLLNGKKPEFFFDEMEKNASQV